jgi:predicted DNA-binding transcriptional regulator YafY
MNVWVIAVQKYIGRTVDIIYLDRRGRLSKRKIRITAVQDSHVRAFDLDRQEPRIFRTDGILVALPAKVRTA